MRSFFPNVILCTLFIGHISQVSANSKSSFDELKIDLDDISISVGKDFWLGSLTDKVVFPFNFGVIWNPNWVEKKTFIAAFDFSFGSIKSDYTPDGRIHSLNKLEGVVGYQLNYFPFSIEFGLAGLWIESEPSSLLMSTGESEGGAFLGTHVCILKSCAIQLGTTLKIYGTLPNRTPIFSSNLQWALFKGF